MWSAGDGATGLHGVEGRDGVVSGRLWGQRSALHGCCGIGTVLNVERRRRSNRPTGVEGRDGVVSGRLWGQRPALHGCCGIGTVLNVERRRRSNRPTWVLRGADGVAVGASSGTETELHYEREWSG
jgi:hypothetical protein